MKRLHPLIIIGVLLALLIAVVPAAGGALGMVATFQECNIILDFFMPEVSEPGDLTVYVLVFDNFVVLASFEVTAPQGSPQQIIYPITQLFVGEQFAFNINPNNDNDGRDYYDFIEVQVLDEVAQPCIKEAQETGTPLNCPYPPAPLLVQGRIVNPTPTYWAPRLDAQSNVNIPVGSSWWILEARDGFYKLFITCQAQYVWVPEEAMGPNFDEVWGGRPLPDAGDLPSD
jgi:hypothetical protein